MSILASLSTLSIGQEPINSGISVRYPLRNTATDPTSAAWRRNNPGYVFIPFVGINTTLPITNANSMFFENRTFNDPDITNWDTSTFVDMGFFLFGCTLFNQFVNLWDTSNCTSMASLFGECPAFNQPLSNWNTSKVQIFDSMFSFASTFNQDISNFDTISGTIFNDMFDNALAFNCGQPSGVAHNLMRSAAGKVGWNVGSATGMAGMFDTAAAFNGDISTWCVSRIPTIPSSFSNNANPLFTPARQPQWGSCAVAFYPMRTQATDPTNAIWQARNPGYTFRANGGIYTVNRMTNAQSMLTGAATFNDPDVLLWDASSFTTIAGLFANCTAFNQPIGSWNISNVTNAGGFLYACSNFNQPVNNLNVSRVVNLGSFFYQCRVFNQPLNNWNTSSATSIEGMFDGCFNFNQDISSWNVSNVTNAIGIFLNATAFNCGQAAGVAHNLMQRTATGGWRTNSMQFMSNMFQNAQSFNGNINAWCVTNNPTVPTNFASGANANFTVNRQPTWGACPIP